jgi:fido (protein-threonine AMPylation protein)
MIDTDIVPFEDVQPRCDRWTIPISVQPKCVWDKDIDWNGDYHLISRFMSEKLNTDLTNDFRAIKRIALVYHSNSLECTLPANVLESDTLKNLSKCWETDSPPKTVLKWDAEGDNVQLKDAWVTQSYFCDKAFTLLCDKNEQFNLDLLCKAHKLLFTNVSQEQETSPGIIRTDDRCAGNYTFTSPKKVRSSLDDLFLFWDIHKDKNDKNFIEVVAKVTYLFITIHPFRNGNGRMCRLLFAALLSRFGLPFPVILSSACSKSRKHYINALIKGQNSGQMNSWYGLCMFSVSTTIRNFNSYCGRI